ncbi:MAG: helix-turn-helix domain-containing protein, partial [Thermomicrobiales bacterium]|nr:helix-turn-helix domain-containing protein [Thermomicrobiales bacterium]
LVLLAEKALQLLDDRLTLEEAVRHLSSFNVAGIAHLGSISDAAIQAANQAGIPLIELPVGSDIGKLEADASQLIMERRREAQRQGQEVGRRLFELAIAGEPLPAMVRTLAELSGRPVVLEGRDGRLLAFQPAPGESITAEDVTAGLSQTRPAVQAWYRNVVSGASSADPPHASYPLDDRWTRVVSPIIGRDGLLGSLSLVVTSSDITGTDAMLASRGAAACAVVLAREQAAATARREIELNVLDEILDGALRSEISLVQQARRLGHVLDQPHAALVARFDSGGIGQPRVSFDAMRNAVEPAMSRLEATVLWRIRHNSIEVVWNPAQTVHGLDFPVALQAELGRQMRASASSLISMGVGGVHAGTVGIRQSHQEAKQALTMSRRLYGPGQVTRFENLGIYRLLFAARDLPELRSFHDDALSILIEYDRQHGAELLRTLGAFFAGRCGPKETAAILGVHRNTVLYRLERIRDLTGFDLDDADVRLRLQLAYSAHIALYAEPAGVTSGRETRTA